MDTRRGTSTWTNSAAEYSEEQTLSILEKCGITVVTETETDFQVLCPFHGNTRSPAMSVSKTNGKFICFNGSCGRSGVLLDLIRSKLKLGEFQSLRLLKEAETEQPSFRKIIERRRTARTMTSFSQKRIDDMHNALWVNDRALEYLHGRGLRNETLSAFKVGYSQAKDRIAVPMHDEDGNPVGVVGRSIDKKRFTNSKKLPTSQTLFNLHRAKRASSSVIIVESSFDVMLLHQLGYSNAVACLMGHFSDIHAEQIDKYFDTCIIMTDNDDPEEHKQSQCRKCYKEGLSSCKGHNPGRDLAANIKSKVNIDVLWAVSGGGVIYPHGAKDPGDMTDEENRFAIKNACNSLEYRLWYN